MKEMSTTTHNPSSPTKISSPSNRKGRTKTSPQKDRSPRDRRERSKSFGNSLAPKSLSPAFYENQTETQNIVLETSILSSSKTNDMNNDDSFFLDEEILLTPENIKSMTSSPVKPAPTSTSSFQSILPKSENMISSSTQNGVDILELLSRKDNIVKLAQAAKHVAEASANTSSTSQPISIPLTKKRSPSSPVPSPSSSMSSVLKTPSPPTRDTSAILPTLGERFAGPGFCNSPAPANLPIPSFVDIPVHQPATPTSPSSANSVQTKHNKSKSFNAGTKTNRGPTRLNFTSPKKDNAPINNTSTLTPTQPLPQILSQQPQSAVPLPFIVPTYHATTSPVEAPPSQYLNQLSDQLKSMLNICSVHS